MRHIMCDVLIIITVGVSKALRKSSDFSHFRIINTERIFPDIARGI